MDLAQRKSAFIESFLKIEEEEIIFRLENQLKLEENNLKNSLKISSEELVRRIEKAEADFENGNFITSKDLLSKYQ